MSLRERIRQLETVVASLEARTDVESLAVTDLDRCDGGINASVTIGVVTGGVDEEPVRETAGTPAVVASERADPLADWSPAAVPKSALEAAIDAADSVPELANELELSTDQALWALGYYDLGSAVPDTGPVGRDDGPVATDVESPAGVRDGDPPGSLTEADVVAVAKRYDTLESVAADLEVDTDRAAAVLAAHDCADEVER